MTKTVHNPLLKRLFFLVGEELPAHEAQHDPRRFYRPKIAESVANFQRVVKELAAEINARKPWAGDELGATDLVPHVFDFFDLREEPVTANVEAKAVIAFGPRNATDDFVGFDYDRAMRITNFLELVGTRKASRTPTDYRHARNIRQRH